jgi:hypothetical protein
LRSAGTVLAIDAFRFGMVTPVLERWRHATKNPNAKLIFICHLMGGHIARYFLEMLGATLALHVVCHGEDGQPRCNPKLMKALGDGRYQTKLDNLAEGACRPFSLRHQRGRLIQFGTGHSFGTPMQSDHTQPMSFFI